MNFSFQWSLIFGLEAIFIVFSMSPIIDFKKNENLSLSKTSIAKIQIKNNDM
jgi:hypothetical protein